MSNEKTTKATQKYLNELRKTLQNADGTCEKVQEWLEKVTHPKNGLTATVVGCANITKQPAFLTESAVQVISLLCQLKANYLPVTLYRYRAHLCDHLLKALDPVEKWNLAEALCSPRLTVKRAHDHTCLHRHKWLYL
eukprot:Platyproteum_vivax@DN3933_c0_g1_i2.p1